MAQGAAMRNGTPMRLVSPAPVLVQPQAANRQNQAAAAAAVSLYSSTPQSIYGANVNTSVNGNNLGGRNHSFFTFYCKKNWLLHEIEIRHWRTDRGVFHSYQLFGIFLTNY